MSNRKIDGLDWVYSERVTTESAGDDVVEGVGEICGGRAKGRSSGGDV